MIGEPLRRIEWVLGVQGVDRMVSDQASNEVFEQIRIPLTFAVTQLLVRVGNHVRGNDDLW